MQNLKEIVKWRSSTPIDGNYTEFLDLGSPIVATLQDSEQVLGNGINKVLRIILHRLSQSLQETLTRLRSRDYVNNLSMEESSTRLSLISSLYETESQLQEFNAGMLGSTSSWDLDELQLSDNDPEWQGSSLEEQVEIPNLQPHNPLPQVRRSTRDKKHAEKNDYLYF